MKKEQLILLVGGIVLGHIVLSNVSPKYRKIAKEVMLGVSAMNLVKLLTVI